MCRLKKNERETMRNAYLKSVPPLSVNDFHQFQRLEFHFYHQRVHFGTEVTIKNHAGDGYQDAECGVVERYGNAVGELSRIAAARGGRTHAKNFYHADQGSEQAHQRAQGSNG